MNCTMGNYTPYNLYMDVPFSYLLEWKITRKKPCNLSSLYSVSQTYLVPIQIQKSTRSMLTVTRKYILGSKGLLLLIKPQNNVSRVSNIESDNSQNVELEDYNNISDRIFPHFTTPSIKICLG